MKRVIFLIFVCSLCWQINAQTEFAPMAESDVETGIAFSNNLCNLSNRRVAVSMSFDSHCPLIIEDVRVVDGAKLGITARYNVSITGPFSVQLGSTLSIQMRPSLSEVISIMTYNISRQKYVENGRVIRASGADVVAVQEIAIIPFFNNFERLKDEMDGYFLRTLNFGVAA